MMQVKVSDLIPSQQGSPKWKALLADSRWETVRRETVRNCKYCHSCRRADVVLHVHHPNYDGRAPWEYAPSEMVVLCESCHDEMHQTFKAFRRFASYQNAKDAKAIVGFLIMLDQKIPLVIRTLANLCR